MKRTLSGKVVSDKRDKTVTVVVERTKVHPIYRKRYKTTKKYSVHDENNQSKAGDFVVIEEVRPLSKTKRWSISNQNGDKRIK